MSSKGFGLIEVVFSLGAVALMLTGAVLMSLKSIDVKQKGFDRGRAMELANVVMEEMVAKKNNDPVNFWSLSPTPAGQIKTGFEGYSYGVNFDTSRSSECGSTSCAEVVVTVTWVRDTTKTVQLRKFFSRYKN
jgi:Tfp pilus assembly protein PilV